MIRVLYMLLALLATAPAMAHKASDSYLWLQQSADNELQGRWDIAVVDLERAVGIDADADGAITWGELQQRGDAVTDYALASLTISNRDRCRLVPGNLLVDTHAGESYASLAFTARCGTAIGPLAVQYQLLFDRDPGHRGLLRVRLRDQQATAVMSPDRSKWTVAANTSLAASGFGDFVREGIWHIVIGYDHVAFLILLLLPAVLRRDSGRWQAVPALAPAMFDMARIVTAFTLAHSVTLSVAALGLVQLPSQPVELAIAASVIVAALHNLFPTRLGPRWALALVFGLVHGFGFASVLSELGGGERLLLELVGFNIGVELGQLAIALALLPVTFVMRSTVIYRRAIVPVASLAVAALAGYWFVERALG